MGPGIRMRLPARRIERTALRKVGQVDPIFLVYNVESVEVTGGNF